jgi:hypothetical protein
MIIEFLAILGFISLWWILIYTLYMIFIKKRKLLEPKNIVEPGLFADLIKRQEDLIESYKQLVSEGHIRSKMMSHTIGRVDATINGHEPIKLFYDFEVDNRKAHEINENLMIIRKNADQYKESLLDIEIIKAIIKRGHETFYKNAAGEFWSRPHGSGGYCIYKKGEFFTEDKQPKIK